ncbi:PREDICTED: PHD finger protein At1g33420-like [Tarenaya hassleriana]|uniref:PHD finger protein At1g33420-like n=1 Tax=Tarenaya hassleriana TaxID=28532 RepID=UPI00053C6984|nr:PREDICTED: PHD finger protein At1g33420-like [Tarenaya hassleriana]
MVMAVINGGRVAKRARRSNRVSADLYDFFTFPAAADGRGGSPLPPFRDGVRSFLSSYARVAFPPSTLFSSLMTWQILLSVGDSTSGSDLSSRFVSLDVVEEDVTRSSRSVYCDHCRVVGWSGHPVCRKRYHFIIRSGDNESIDGIGQKSCSLSDSSVLLADDVENWVYSQLDDDHTHLLHGVIHSNGYAHLLSLNGREGGSGYLPGRAIMDFWDRLCSWLRVRKASVMDVSRKYGMDYRLLHAVTRGHSWYGEWGYEFKSGSYALTRDAYQNAVDTLSDVSLSQFMFRGRTPRTQLHSIIPFYQSLSCSELVTLRDLFSFLLQLIHNIRSGKSEELASVPSDVLCSWTRSDVGTVQKAMIKVLKAAGGERGIWVSRRALKGSTCRTVSLELLDYCLCHLDGEPTGDGSHIVCSRFNASSNDLEFRLVLVNSINPTDPRVDYPSEEHVKRDLRYVYDTLLHPQTMSKFRSQETREKMMDASTKILDCKHFIKDYLPVNVNPFAINLWCHVELSDQSKECPAPPPELLVLPLNATVTDLKIEAAKAFQEVYAMFKRFEVVELLGYGSLEDSMTLKFLVGTSGMVRIKGRCSSKHGLLRYRMERGVENWKVDCVCGTKDDDGERMLSCDVCGVWHHTRCAGIDNTDALPSKFHCFRCIQLYRKRSKQSDIVHDSGQVPQPTFVCRGESVDMDNGSNLSVPLTVG